MHEMTRGAFADEISRLEQDLLKMGSVVEQMVHKSVDALVTRNVAAANEVLAMDDAVDHFNISIENRCLQLLALQQPMARDLRTIAAAMKIITDIERAGDYAVDIAKTAKALADSNVFRPHPQLKPMSELVKRMIREVLEAFVQRDVSLIEAAIQADDAIDHLNRLIIDDLVASVKETPAAAEELMQAILVSRYLERIADHMTNVGERVYYMQTGELKELHT
jgi:phosphate transport system protein